MKIIQWERSTFTFLKKLLDESAGYSVSLETELEYFEPHNSASWFYALDDTGEALGFVRIFIQPSGFYPGEIFVRSDAPHRSEIVKKLIGQSLSYGQFISKGRIRFDISQSDSMMIDELIKMGFNSRIEKYLCYEYFLKNSISVNRNESVFIPKPEQYNSIKNIFCQLHEMSDEEIERGCNEGRIFGFMHQESIVSAVRVNFEIDQVEIVEIVTDTLKRQKGFATQLLNHLVVEFYSRGFHRVFLFVKDENLSAIQFYEKNNFTIDKLKSQTWLSKILD